MYLLILVIPVVNFLLLSFSGRLLGSKFVILLIFNLFFLLSIAFHLFYEVVLLDVKCFILVGNWVTVGSVSIN